MSDFREMYPGQIETHSEITQLLGAFVARWSLAEFSLMLAVLVALKSPRQEVATTILASTNSTEAKIKIVKKLIGVAPIGDEQKANIRNALRKLEGLCEQRNALMHHLWSRRDNGEIVTVDFREPDSAKSQSLRTADGLRKLCNEVVDAAHAISKATQSTWIDENAAVALKL